MSATPPKPANDDLLFAKFIERDGRHYKLFALWLDGSISQKDFNAREAKLLDELRENFSVNDRAE